ncbi:MAG: aminoacyl-tRNA hydrolase [Minisyncoccia bacterium]
MYIVVGLGNPGEKYAHTRHNAGRLAEEFISNADKVKAKFLFSDTFMNRSGSFVSKFVKPARPNGRSGGSKKAAEKLVVLYDDLDLPLGRLKVSFGRSSGGHRGVESVIRALSTENFIRIRIGIAQATPSGKIKKPKGEKAVLDFILGEWRPAEEAILKKVFKRALEALETIVVEGRETAMNRFNSLG